MADTTQEKRGEGKIDEIAEKWRRVGKKILEEVDGGRAADLENESLEDFAHTLIAAATWGLTVDEVSAQDTHGRDTSTRDVLAMLERLFDARINPGGWIVSHAERLVDGKPVETWICEHAASKSPESWKGVDPYMDYQGVGTISIETDGDFYFSHKAPHWARLVRDVHETFEKLVTDCRTNAEKSAVMNASPFARPVGCNDALALLNELAGAGEVPAWRELAALIAVCVEHGVRIEGWTLAPLPADYFDEIHPVTRDPIHHVGYAGWCAAHQDGGEWQVLTSVPEGREFGDDSDDCRVSAAFTRGCEPPPLSSLVLAMMRSITSS